MMRTLVGRWLLLPFVVGPLSAATDLPGLSFTEPFFPGVSYRETLPSPDRLLGFPVGERAATAEQIEACLKAWAAATPDRTLLVEYARSHEGRPLHYLVVTAPANRARLEQIRAGLDRLADPRETDDAGAERLIAELPAVAWLAYTIHGDETEGSDAGLAVLYHLLAAEDPEVERLLQEVVVIVDPLMNPDGRDRFLKMVAEHRGASPNVDDQSLLHRGYWPYGRGNHYLFDLNRDWAYARHPETRGRMRAVREWHPQLFVDAHGMGPQETHLFSPPREPVNPNMPLARRAWSERFARDQAAAFDRAGLVYYTGEWHEEWYPGYSDAWASYHGAVGILYEQARVAEDAVRRPEGRLLSYRESVRHHVIGSMANLKTLQQHARDLKRYSREMRVQALAPDGVYAQRTFAFPPSANAGRLTDLVELLQLQGFEVFRAESDLLVGEAKDTRGQRHAQVTLPAGTVLVPNRQPLGALVAALLEFDPHFSEQVLTEERKELLRKGESRIYDVTTWNLAMMYGLPAYELPTGLPAGARRWTSPEATAAAAGPEKDPPVAWILDGADDRSVAAAARLLEREVEVRVAEKPFRLDEQDFARGSVVVVPLDNRGRLDRAAVIVPEVAGQLRLPLHRVGSGLGAGELPDLGSEHFRRLAPPRLAILGRDRVSSTDFGATWYLIDQALGIRHSHLADLSAADLRRYNVVVIPAAGSSVLASNQMADLKEWVRGGGTLIAVAGAAAALADEQPGLSKVRDLPDVFEELPNYEIAVLREWLAESGSLPAPAEVWSHDAGTELNYPWPVEDGAYPDAKELKRRDAWQKLFMPQGAFLASRVDTNHWLTMGCDRWLPVLVGDESVLMAAEGVETPIRYGVFVAGQPGAALAAEPGKVGASGQADAEPATGSSAGKKKVAPRVGWSVLPSGVQMQLRMSGLLWPEATHRLANAAYLTRERLGRGQVILFATPPAFRASTHGTARLLLNAIVYGPGCGASPRIEL